MLKFHPHARLVLAVAASLTLSGPAGVMAQDVTISNFQGPSTVPSWPVAAGVSTGTYTVGVGVGNGTAVVGVGTTSAGQVKGTGISVGIPNTNRATSQIPTECEMYPGVDVSANC
jgi:hypothetical protein